MNLLAPHRWDVTPAEAVAIQRELAARVLRAGPPVLAGCIAGVGVGFEDEGRTTRAAVAVLDMPACRVVETARARLPTRFPYGNAEKIHPWIFSARLVAAHVRDWLRSSITYRD